MLKFDENQLKIEKATSNYVKGGGRRDKRPNQKGSTKYIFFQIFSPSDTKEDSKFVFEKSSNSLKL